APAGAAGPGGSVAAAMDRTPGDAKAGRSGGRRVGTDTLFREGWDRGGASPPAGEGGAPRQGWIGAQDGVFYRLWITTYSFAREFQENGNQHVGAFTLYTPFSRRFELRYDLPIITDSRGPHGKYHTAAGAIATVPRVLLAE